MLSISSHNPSVNLIQSTDIIYSSIIVTESKSMFSMSSQYFLPKYSQSLKLSEVKTPKYANVPIAINTTRIAQPGT